MINKRIKIDYDKEKIAITTICSHSSLQIFHGARQEGFRTIGICTKEQERLYSSFPLASPDRLIVVERFADLLQENIQEELLRENAIIIPHGSFVEYVGATEILSSFSVPLFGNKAVLPWESDRAKQREWMLSAEIAVPKAYSDIAAVDGPVIAKLSGAKGGRGLVSARNGQELANKLDAKMLDQYTIQEYIFGSRYYPHYFYSQIRSRLEILGIDRRDETDIDELYRYRDFIDHPPSYVVVGNQPLVVRESLLGKIMKYGEGLVETSRRLFSPGLFGPFCLEMVCTADMKFVAFEVSARIVAGTNLYPLGSPYSPYYFTEAMSTGRRIAREIREAASQNRLDEIIS
ncbi:formate--phosphoribosylaminoimidazolecarboxamide ligase [Candidatus Acetothermia bacterium]|jgi:5-formaminoimidazole-4-carboxamide-1-(beta)-D-ribofuranosyl 5'-monophosphate synthetase|nr:formate--phosphoribosylaminoimidazolecarboxamide ligase [Candidatus Acetothermia bacterium]MCI2426660.1 formate--phosphoribosylaminoimidazolecarboxamide ligase [Candidatus Acetothermia bacterium]MCI2427824.1 formate--phosphoribosylaminoimidazolecarboxamide ligase [Candidatus Acetothermia bacterium]MCI2428408.1 formate--phosphoribosylaminoimidazolecarboxamide ligase [Candidatus Acetothermia bacterium]